MARNETTSDGIPLEDDWVSHASALRALAAALCADQHEAEDVLQDTWVRASSNPRGTRKRAWLATVLRNLVRDRARSRRVQRSSELSAAREEALPNEAEIVERLEVAERVAREVASLEEPYRQAIHLRYFEGLSPEEIARRARIPLETVRTRLRRGLALLRERMDRVHRGDRSAWISALAPVALRSEPGATVTAGTSLAAIGGVVMSAKLLVSVATAAAVAWVAYLVWPSGEGSNAIAEQVAASSGDQLAPEPPPSSPLIAAAPGEPGRAGAGSASAAPSFPGDASTEVRGTAVIVDEDGVEHPNEAGQLVVFVSPNLSVDGAREISIEHGAWSLRVPSGSFFVVSKLFARGRQADLFRRVPIYPGPDSIEVRGRWLKRGRLRVIDAATKEDLQGIEVRCAPGWRANPRWTHPGDHPAIETVIRGADSPFDLPERMWLTPYWVHADGHAWSRIDFDHRIGGESTVELSTPAAVDVWVSGGEVPDGACVRLYPTSEPVESWLAIVSVRVASAGPTRILDLAPGRYVACVEVGEYEGTRRIGEAPVELAPHVASSVTVPIVPALLGGPEAHLYGTLALPRDADPSSLMLLLWREGGGMEQKGFKVPDMISVDGDERLRRWDAGRVPIGTWGAEVLSLNYQQRVRVDSGENAVEIRVPELVTLSIEVVDAATGDPLEPENLSLRGERIEGLSKSYGAMAVSSGMRGRYRFVACPNHGRIVCSASGYGPYEDDVDLRGGNPTLRIALRRMCGVRVQVFRDGERMRAGLDFWTGIEVARSGSSIPCGSPEPVRENDVECTILLEQPGRYRLSFPALEGCEPIDPIDAEVYADQIAEVRVQVGPKR